MKSNSYVKLPKDKFPHVAVDDDGYMERFTTPALTKVVHLGSPDKVTIRIAPPVNPYYPRWNPININTIPLRRSYPIWLGHIYSINYNTYIYIDPIQNHIYIYPIYILYISYMYIYICIISPMHPALPEGFSDLRRNPSVSNANDSRVAVVGRMAPFWRGWEIFGRSRWCPMVN